MQMMPYGFFGVQKYGAKWRGMRMVSGKVIMAEKIRESIEEAAKDSE